MLQGVPAARGAKGCRAEPEGDRLALGRRLARFLARTPACPVGVHQLAKQNANKALLVVAVLSTHPAGGRASLTADSK